MPLQLKQRGLKKTYWIIGTLCGERIRESTRTSDRRLAEAKLIAVTKEIEDRLLYGPKHSFTFAEAVELHVNRTHPKPKQAALLMKLLNYFGPKRCAEITPAMLMEYEKHRFKKPVSNSTLIRAVYNPMQSILNTAARNQLAPPVLLPRPRAAKVRVPPAPEDFLQKLLACEMHHWLRAAILIMTYHGTRPSDLKRLRWRDVSFASNTITFGKTKNGLPHAPMMHPEVRDALRKLLVDGAWSGQAVPVFEKIQANEPATYINQYLKTVCKQNGLPFYSTHKIGRHAFASRLLSNNCTLKETQEGGNWSSIQVVADLYGHLERSHVDKIVTGMRIGGTKDDQFSPAQVIYEEKKGLSE